MNIIAGWMMPEMNWALKLEPYRFSFCSAKVSRRLVLAAEDLDQRVAGVHLLDVAVELARRAPLLDELRLGPFADRHATT